MATLDYLSDRFRYGTNAGCKAHSPLDPCFDVDCGWSWDMNLTSDQWILWQYGFLRLNGTILTTWAMMFAMTLGAVLITRRLSTEGAISGWQSALEIIVTTLEQQIKEVGLGEPRRYLPFLGTLFLFVAT